MKRLIVINPNSNATITRAMAAAVEDRQSPQCRIDTEMLPEGPFGIESDADIAAVVRPICNLIRARPVDGYVIGCYSDPGIDDARSVTEAPVFGIQESAARFSTRFGDGFGVLALSQQSIDRHLRYLQRIGLSGRLAGEHALDMPVAEGTSTAAFARLLDGARALKQQFDPTSIILGCTGMTIHRSALQNEIGLPVIDPTQAAVDLALERLWADSTEL